MNINSDKNEAQALPDHEYDGIRELDNPMPRWWIIKFYITIVFSVLYFFYYQMSQGPTQEQEYAMRMNEVQVRKSAALAAQPQMTDADFEQISKDSNLISMGQKLYSERCVSCHGASGEGGIGPNLTDSYFIHGSKFTEILKVVEIGVSDKGMPPWGALLKKDEIQSLVIYVHTLKGKNIANGKAPQGSLVE